MSAVAATRDHILAAHLLMMPEGHQIEPDYMLAAVLATTPPDGALRAEGR